MKSTPNFYKSALAIVSLFWLETPVGGLVGVREVLVMVVCFWF